LWAVTFVAWRRARNAGARPPRAAHEPAEHAAPVSLRRACLANDAGRARTALLDWAAHAWSDDPPRNLVALASRFGDGEVKREIVRLDRALYAGERTSWQGEPLWRVARRGLAPPTQAEAPAKPGSDLPELYLR
ncbi:MAG: protein BatD, partial [Gammaproteobacteria bacterium]|nr:protein BatD [Gammaproteobacteria bacterium]